MDRRHSCAGLRCRVTPLSKRLFGGNGKGQEMNEQQLERWKQLSAGLARSAFPSLTPARQQKLLAAIEDFIDGLTSWGDLDDIHSWDGPGVYVCDEMSSYLWDHRYEFERERKGCREAVLGRFGDMLSACIRAGFDVAVAPSAGVVGFTVCDLRGAFGGSLPDWVTNWFEPPLPAGVADGEGVWL